MRRTTGDQLSRLDERADSFHVSPTLLLVRRVELDYTQMRYSDHSRSNLLSQFGTLGCIRNNA